MPESDFSIEIDGQPALGQFHRGYGEEHRSSPVNPSDREMYWQGEIAADQSEHRVALRVKGILVAVRYANPR